MLYELFVERWVLNGAVPVRLSITCLLPAHTHSPLRSANQRDLPQDTDNRQVHQIQMDRIYLCQRIDLYI